MNNDVEAKKCLKALQTINEYLENECVYSDDCRWVDQKGYSFETDIGYFLQGIENFEGCLIKRLRGARPKYAKVCEKYNKDV